MKRKLALLMAAVMALSISIMPMSAFAASSNNFSRTFTSLAEGTMLYEQGMLSAQRPNATGGDIEAVLEGAYLDIKFSGNNRGTTGSALEIKLNNGEWFFKNAIAGLSTAPLVPANLVTRGGDTDAFNVNSISDMIRTDGSFNNAIATKDTGGSLGDSRSNYDTRYGIYAEGTAIGSRYDGVYVSLPGHRTEIPFVMAVDGATAHIIVLASIRNDQTLSIPMCIISDDESVPLTADVRDYGVRGAGVSSGRVNFVQGVVGATRAFFDDPPYTGREEVNLEKLIIEETRPGTIKPNEEFRIFPPTGYRFVDTPFTYSMDGLGTGNVTELSVNNYNRERERRLITPTVGDGFVSSSGTTGTGRPGRIVIENIIVEPISTNTWGSFTGFRIAGRDSGISDFTFTTAVGERNDWGVLLKAAGESLPTLFAGIISGHWDFRSSDRALDAVDHENGIFAVTDDDGEAYKLMKVRIEEATVNSWWTNRETKLHLPEGVTVIGVEVTDSDNAKRVDGDQISVLSGAPGWAWPGVPGVSKDDYIRFDRNEITFRGFDGGIKDVKDKKVWIELDIYVSIALSMAGKDIELSISGGGLRDSELPDPLVVAKAVATTEVETRVSNVAIGRNAQPTADIILRETSKGAWAEGSILYVSLANFNAREMSDLVFHSGEVEVTAGDVEIDWGITNRSGSTSFLLNRTTQETSAFEIEIEAISTEASEITISNVRTSTYTTLPVSDRDAYPVIVYGTAVAANFYEDANAINSSNNLLRAGLFNNFNKDFGIFKDYVRTSGAWGSGGFDPTKEFIISTTGDLWYQIDGGDRVLIPADMAPRNENGTILLSVRLVAEAFGCVVEWDPNRGVATVVLSENPRNAVQFTASSFDKEQSAYYTVNGIERLMLYPNGQVATADIYDSRMFVPLRYLGIAMGVEWDNIGYEDGYAYFNLKTDLSALAPAVALAPTADEDAYQEDDDEEAVDEDDGEESGDDEE